MIANANLYVEGLDNPIPLSDVHWELEKIVDRGLEMSHTEPSNITFRVQDISTVTFFYDWVKQINSRKAGRIEYIDARDGRISETLSFQEALCANVSLHYNKRGTTPFSYITSIAFYHTNYEFQEGMVEQQAAAAEESSDEDFDFTEIYLTDVEGNRIEEVSPGMSIEVVIQSTNCVGKTLSIDLNNDVCDYKYNGEILANDTLSDYSISQNEERIPLEVIEQQPENNNENADN